MKEYLQDRVALAPVPWLDEYENLNYFADSLSFDRLSQFGQNQEAPFKLMSEPFSAQSNSVYLLSDLKSYEQHSFPENSLVIDSQLLAQEDDYKQIQVLIELFQKQRTQDLALEYLHESYSTMHLIQRQGKKYSKELKEALKTPRSHKTLHLLRAWEKIEKLRLESYTCSSEKILFEKIKQFIFENDIFEDIELIEDKTSARLEEIRSDHLNYLVPLYDEQIRFLLIKRKLMEDSQMASFYVLSLVNLIEDYGQQNRTLNHLTHSAELVKKSFSQLPLPVVVLSENGEIVLHNQKFSKLNIGPKRCQEFEDGQTFEFDGQMYAIMKDNFFEGEGNYTYLCFVPALVENQSSGSYKNAELGIISSSVAHELNNPIGGILAGLGVLQLDPWSDEVKESLDEMREGAIRCKQLVEMFLGLSKAKNIQSGHKGSFKEAFERGMNLIRFRTMETAIRIDWQYQQEGAFHRERSFNMSIFSMFFYLLFGEILTAYAHFNLVAMVPSGSAKLIEGEIFEQPEQVSLQVKMGIDLNSIMNELKLAKHLLDTEGISFSAHKNTLYLRVKK